MADLRRLGKRGAYRLGRLGAVLPEQSGPPGPHYPSFAPGHRGPAAWWVLGCLAAVAAIAAGAAAGWWFLPFLAGLAGGIAARSGRWRLRAALLALAVVAAVGWAVPLCWAAWRGAPIGATARVVAALAGLPAHAPVAIASTLLVAVIQALAGCWLTWSLFPKP
ncbi:MAG TPA: hypothetical protein VMV92_33110 [Streptosporangiaceae bacterium]|nr:hypothetical protein [Streptosporangiaceae bacterium]